MDRLLTLRALARRIAVPRSRLRAWIESGEFPPPVVLPDGAERWRLSTVRAWLADLLPAGHCQHDEDDGQACAEAEQIDPATLSPLALEILQALSESSEAVVRQQKLAQLVGCDEDTNGGSWKRATAELRSLGLAVSEGKAGLRLGPRWSSKLRDFIRQAGNG